MSSEHAREVLREVAMETADEGNVPGRPSLTGLAIAVIAILALLLVFVATTTRPSERTIPQAPAENSTK